MHSFGPDLQDHRLAHNPIKALIAPRPIGWVSTLSATGVPNLAPYSFFNLVNDTPCQVMMSSMGMKDSLANIQATGECVFNAVSRPQLEAMNITAGPHAADVDEFEAAGLVKLASDIVKPHRVQGAPWHMECTLDQIIELKSPPASPNTRNAMIIATVVRVHIANQVLTPDRVVDASRLQAVARGGYREYSAVESVFELARPN